MRTQEKKPEVKEDVLLEEVREEEEEEEQTGFYTPPGSSGLSDSTSATGTGGSSRAEWEENKSPEQERLDRKELEETARQKLEEERLKRKEQKEAEWRAKYGFDKDDPILKKKEKERQEKQERKKNFWKRCAGNGGNPFHENNEPAADGDGGDLDEVKENIADALDDAWLMDVADRKKVVKRLLLEWHPDKNPDKSEESKIIFQHLQKEIKRCEGGIPRIKLTKWRNFMFGKAKGPTPTEPFKGPTSTAPFKEPVAPSSGGNESKFATGTQSHSPLANRRAFSRATTFTPGMRSFEAKESQNSVETGAAESNNYWKDVYSSRYKDKFNGENQGADAYEKAHSPQLGRRFKPDTADTDFATEAEPTQFSRFTRSQSSHEHSTRDSFFKSYIDKMRETRQRARGESPGRGGARGESPARDRNNSPSFETKDVGHGHGHGARDSPTFRRKKPRTVECGRWFGQAKKDLLAAHHDMNAEEPAYEWVCLKCHHAAEKALKATVLAQDSDFVKTTHDLNAIAGLTQNVQLSRLSSQLSVLLGEPERIVYPNAFHAPKIPHEAYSHGIATSAISLSKMIVDSCGSIIKLKIGSFI